MTNLYVPNLTPNLTPQLPQIPQAPKGAWWENPEHAFWKRPPQGAITRKAESIAQSPIAPFPQTSQAVQTTLTQKLPDWQERVMGYRPLPEYQKAWDGLDMQRKKTMLNWQPDYRQAYLAALSNPDKLYEVRDSSDQASYQLTGTQMAERIWNEAQADYLESVRERIAKSRQRQQQQQRQDEWDMNNQLDGLMNRSPYYTSSPYI